ncbi:MAG: hypothetical protein LM576_06405 [Thermofilum sp.]|jgi:hypothetical protein|nr:hypothetical protein [Thermofilum sp.]
MSDRSWRELYEEVARAKGGRREKLLEELKLRLIREVAGSEIPKLKEWISQLSSVVEQLSAALGVKGAVYPKELRSFVEDPEAHLRKKLFIYAHDLARGRLGPEEFYAKACAAVKTSLMTNGRALYQSWVYAALVLHMARRGFRLVYPDDLHLHLERSGRQRTGAIPPNAVLSDGYRALSLFLEAPRPVGWEDSGDLARVWKLYTALRPDMLAYGGRVLNIVVRDGEPPVLRPGVIVECKELEDWYKRARELKGPLASPLSAEEWRERWISGLYAGLADVLNIKVSEVAAKLKERRGLRLRDPQIAILYKRFYEPREMVLVSRAPVPGEVKSQLEREGIRVIDGVGFNIEALAAVADILEEEAGIESGRVDFVELTPRARELLRAAILAAKERGLGGAPPEIVERALEALLQLLSSRQQAEQRAHA